MMENNEIKKVNAQIQCEQIAAYQRDVIEFTKLGKRHSSLWFFVFGVMPFAGIFYLSSVFDITTELFNLLCLFSLLFSFVIGLIKTEIENTNRRIDLLQKIHRQDYKQR